ncbi:hypothetical protein BDZ90DRAFT_279349 [Jaminaea rosea]|uniref:Uncharacterized protein n=1 Tax=Jaminaea rosea TaxID=1569628 RepID=A0A316USE4_9BASI|nr:hypothetical protein BDZ90DRAFT_279349 [Jaminaea rosea]PWN28229.1 hypothetical protein BDZ90DRAFT_279349 [Jaminaea rosea]
MSSSTPPSSSSSGMMPSGMPPPPGNGTMGGGQPPPSQAPPSAGSTPLSVFFVEQQQQQQHQHRLFPRQSAERDADMLQGVQDHFDAYAEMQRRQASSSSSSTPITTPAVGSNTPTLSAIPSSNPTPSQSQSPFPSDGGPAPFFTFALAAVALFVIVVAFVLLRICLRNRRLRRLGLLPDGGNGTGGPMDRFLGVGPMGGAAGFGYGREMHEDTSVPPKLWEARIVPYKGSGGEGGGAIQPPASWNDEPAGPLTSMSGKAYGGGGGAGSTSGGWDKLMPIAASLPTTIYTSSGAAAAFAASEGGDASKDKSKSSSSGGVNLPGASNRKASKKKRAATAKESATVPSTPGGTEQQPAPTDTMPGSVNVSVLIAMPSAPKGDGEELPELMLGTAAVPIYSTSPSTAAKDKRSMTSSSNASSSMYDAQVREMGYFSQAAGSSSSSSRPNTATATAAATATRTHPTRAQLISLFEQAREAKERARKKRAADAVDGAGPEEDDGLETDEEPDADAEDDRADETTMRQDGEGEDAVRREPAAAPMADVGGAGHTGAAIPPTHATTSARDPPPPTNLTTTTN